MERTFEGKVVVVTGAASGMGRGCADYLAARGARLALIDPAVAGLEAAAQAAKDAGAEVAAAAISVADGAAVARFVDGVAEAWGGIDGLVHAGAILRYSGLLATDRATWDEVIEVNLTGTFVINQAVARVMVAGGRGGAIVNIASVAAVMGLSSLTAYSSSKGGVAAFTRSVAKDLLPHGIRVNYICPGFVESGMTEDLLTSAEARAARAKSTGVGRICQPEDIAAACAFLLGEGALFISGHGLMVDSGASIAGS
jgi:NAD(P)-dependent dehydrogenase (short-subunit alcohol dehydrogenase family)